MKGSISSTKDELNGTIAKNHDELVALKRHGERDYFEFDLWKGKQFQRSGPISLSLRRADGKHLNYDVVALVDDNSARNTSICTNRSGSTAPVTRSPCKWS